MNKKRALSSEEQALWQRVTKTVTTRHVPASQNRPQPIEKEPSKPVKTPETLKQAYGNIQTQQPITALDMKLRRRLKRGQETLHATLDLHGFTQEKAHKKLIKFITHSHARGHRYVLVITGKGNVHKPGAHAHGILRRMVPIWLTDARIAPQIIGFETAHRHHGGSGALYIHLRRNRSE